MKKKPATPLAAPAAPVIVASFSLAAATLKVALARLKPAVGFRLAHAIFSHVLIARRDGATTLAATDLAVHASHTIPSSFTPPASDLSRKLAALRFARENCLLLLPFADLADAARDCDRTGDITFTLTESSAVELSFPANGITVRRESFRADPSDFVPPAPFPAGAQKMTLDDPARMSFFRALEVASSNETRHVLNGVALDGSKPGHHAAIGTNGRALIYANGIQLPFTDIVIVPNSPALAGKFLRDLPWTLEVAAPTPRKHGHQRIERALAKLGKMLKPFHKAAAKSENERVPEEMAARFRSLELRRQAVENYRDRTEATRLRIVGDGTTYELRAVEGNYPNYRQVIPDEANYRLTVPFGPAVRSHLLAILPKLTVEKDATIEVCIDKAVVSLSVGKTHVKLPSAAAWKGDEAALSLRLERDFLLTAARHGFEEFHATSEIDPVVFHAGTSRMVVMPKRA